MDLSGDMSSAHDSSEDARRAAKLAAAKRRLKSFRATKSSGQKTIPTSPSATDSRHISSAPLARPSSPIRHALSPKKQHSKPHSHHRSVSGGPLEPSHATNIILFPDVQTAASPKHGRNGSEGKGKGRAEFLADNERSAGMEPDALMGPAVVTPKRGHAHRRSQSRACAGHTRARSSISLRPGGLSRRSVIGVFDIEAECDGDGNGEGAFAFNPFPTATRLSGPFLNPPALAGDGINMPEEIITTPATPQVDPPDLADPFFSPRAAGSDVLEDRSAVKARLSTFSFGSKPPQGVLSPTFPPEPAPRELLASPGGRRRFGVASSPTASPRSGGRVSIPLGLLDDAEHRNTTTPNSRPPSVILTQATPLHFSPTRHRPTSSLMPAGVAGDEDDNARPATPGTPARKRHSHTRSNSISLPSLKLGGGPRPVSLGVPNSPGYPASPGSPGSSSSDARSRLSSPLSGTRLKFEPSGRGAEAEQEKEEYRRRALDKLNGGGSGPVAAQSPLLSFLEEATSEIALPDLDDDEASSTTSSVRPLSGIFTSSTFHAARPHSLSIGPPSALATAPVGAGSPASPFWASYSPYPDEGSPSLGSAGAFGDRWIPFGPMGSTSPADQGLGFGMDLSLAKRGSLTRGIDVMAVVEEKADAEAEAEADAEADIEAEEDFDTGAEGADEAGGDDEETDEAEAVSFTEGTEPLAGQPGPPHNEGTADAQPITTGSSGLRQLHLLASTNGTPTDAVRPRQPSMSPSSGSPTKGYGAIGKGRPRPLPGITNKPLLVTESAHPPGAATATTPVSSRSASSLAGRTRAPSVGSRGSSISYRRHDTTSQGSEGSSASSSRWSSSARVSSSIASPPSPDQPLYASTSLGPALEGDVAPQHSRWDSGDRPSGVTRPCPRPQSLIGLGLSSAGSRRILAEVHESDEDESTDQLGLASIKRPAAEYRARRRKSADLPRSVRDSHDSSTSSVPWRDHHLELELERDALREDVEMWRTRCKDLEDKLDAERRESAVLRDRVRKLSDRLSTASTAAPPNMNIAPPDAQAAAEMRQQLFQLTAALERERREKEQALARLAEVQQTHDLTPRLESPNSPSPRWPASSAPALPLHCPSPIITPATPIASSHPSPVVTPQSRPEPRVDPNTHRMKSWGFPRVAATGTGKDPSPTKRKDKRDSFFGLSKMPQAALGQDGGELTPDGLDLPPFVFPHSGEPTGIRVVSEPKVGITIPPASAERRRYISNPSPRSIHHDGYQTGGPFGFLSSYLGVSPPQGSLDGGFGRPAVLVVDDDPPRPVDMRGSCADCRGDLMEV